MNKGIKRAVIFMMVFTALVAGLTSFRGFFVKAADTDVIRNDKTGIPDQALYQMILKELGKTPDSTFTEAETQSVRAIQQDVFYEDDSDRKEEDQVVSLQGIEKLTNLIKLELGRNKITDLKPLENLTKLTILNLKYSYCITSIEGLRSLTQLEYLTLPPTVTDLSPIAGMKGLIDLRVAAGIRALPDLTGHSKLTGFGTHLERNNLTKKELTKKLPKQLVADKAWLKQTIDLQEYNVKKMVKTLKLTSPKKMTKITSSTKTITGKVGKNMWVRLCRPHSSHTNGSFKGSGVWSSKNGVFKFKKLNLKKYKKKKLWLELYYKNSYYKSDVLIKTFAFTLKK